MIKNGEKSEDEDDSMQEPGERWDPLGADDEDVQKDAAARACESLDEQLDGKLSSSVKVDVNRIKSLEEEQEVLTTSLMALTSHFAQVQLRLRQIVGAPAAHRDLLLKSLEEFAFRGIPELSSAGSLPESDEIIVSLERSRNRQFELIDRLKKQLTELEKFAYESGAPVLPQSILFEKHKIIIDELKKKFNLNVSDFNLPQLSSEDIKTQVDTAIGEFVGPLKMKDQLVAQLKTQITDLERFIAFLQHSNPQEVFDDVNPPLVCDNMDFSAYNTYSAKKKNCQNANNENRNDASSKIGSSSNYMSVKSTPENFNSTDVYSSKTHSLLGKASTLLQMFALTQFGCGSSTDGKNTCKHTLKRQHRPNHWGDTRAQLEVDIQEVAALASALKHDQKKYLGNMSQEYETYVSDSDDEGEHSRSERKAKPCERFLENFSLTKVELTTVVRKNLAVTLQKLIQHGLRNNNGFAASSLVPFIGCLQLSSGKDRRTQVGNVNDVDDCSIERNAHSGQMHAWELILQYYFIKNGENYNETPSRKLSQSFNLDIVGNSAPISNKQSLLSTIGTIIEMHKPYKRSNNSHFKAFVCAALNARKLVVWLNLIFQCSELINTFYISSSYVAKTGFRDALHSLDILSKYDFDLPIDLAVRHFQNIKDVFM